MPHFELHTFGALWAGGREGTGPVIHTQNACRLLVLLAASHGRFSRRATLAELLWPDAPEPNRQHSLRQLLCEIRKKLGPTAIEESSDTLSLSGDEWWVDFIQFEKAVSASHWDEAAALYQGPFAAELDFEGTVELRARLDAVRARLHVKANHCFVRLIHRALAEGDLAAAEQWARALVAIDPFEERPRRLLMQVLHAEHQDTDALGVFEEYRTYVAQLFGDDPSLGLYDLALDIGKAANSVLLRAHESGERDQPEPARR